MTYSVWVKVENDDGQPGDPDEVWWVADHHPTRSGAIEHAELILQAEYERTGVEPVRLDTEDPEDPESPPFRSVEARYFRLRWRTGHTGRWHVARDDDEPRPGLKWKVCGCGVGTGWFHGRDVVKLDWSATLPSEGLCRWLRRRTT
jgi:hypothetical protein